MEENTTIVMGGLKPFTMSNTTAEDGLGVAVAVWAGHNIDEPTADPFFTKKTIQPNDETSTLITNQTRHSRPAAFHVHIRRPISR